MQDTENLFQAKMMGRTVQKTHEAIPGRAQDLWPVLLKWMRPLTQTPLLEKHLPWLLGTVSVLSASSLGEFRSHLFKQGKSFQCLLFFVAGASCKALLQGSACPGSLAL